jgi:hypothetical protein
MREGAKKLFWRSSCSIGAAQSSKLYGSQQVIGVRESDLCSS